MNEFGVVMRTLLVIALVLPGLLNAQTLTDWDQTIESLAPAFMEDHDIPGMAIAVVDGGEHAVVRGFGLGHTANAVPATGDSTFYLASTAKLFTALAVLTLQAQGQLELDADVNRYLDWEIDNSELARSRYDTC